MGYATGQFGKNHLGDLNRYLPTLHGFDEFHGYLYHLDALSDPYWHSYPKDPAFRAKYGPRNVLHTWATDKDERAMLEIVMATHAGITTVDFELIVKDWLAAARHPKYKRPYTECVYQPMLELLAYLRASGFKTFIVSGGGIEFMRPWTERRRSRSARQGDPR